MDYNYYYNDCANRSFISLHCQTAQRARRADDQINKIISGEFFSRSCRSPSTKTDRRGAAPWEIFAHCVLRNRLAGAGV